jgi:hypothetical protein
MDIALAVKGFLKRSGDDVAKAEDQRAIADYSNPTTRARDGQGPMAKKGATLFESCRKVLHEGSDNVTCDNPQRTLLILRLIFIRLLNYYI